MKYIFAAFILFILLPFAIAWISMAPWVPTRKKDIEKLLKILDLQAWQKFLEIGCGDARVSRSIAQKFQKSYITAIELAYPIYFLAKLRNINGPQNLHVKLENAFKQNFGDYDVIYVYGMPDKMWNKIVPKFLKQAKQWSKLYSYIFSFPKEYKDQTKTYGKKNEAKIHVLEKK